MRPSHAPARSADDGQLREAIDLLTAENRRRRDPRLDRRLVELRYEAFRRETWPDTRPPWPDAVDDLFTGARVPEVHAADLSVEQVRSAIRHHGALLVRGFADAEHVQVLVDDIDRVIAAYDAHVEHRAPEGGDPAFVPFAHEPKWLERAVRREVGGVLAVDSPPALFDIIETFEAAHVGRIVREYFGEQPALLAKKWTLRKVSHEAGPSDWHQDGAFMGQDIRSLNVWLSLSHCGDDAPGLDVVTRRFDEVLPTGTDGAHLTWTVGPGLIDRVAPGSVVRPIFAPGDALIFDHLYLHRTAVVPTMTRDRYAVEAWFLSPSTYAAMTAPGDSQETAPPSDQLPLLY